VIQAIRSTWGKTHRGGAGARIRNRVPEALELPFPPHRVEEPSYVIHSSQFVFPGAPTGLHRLPAQGLQVRPLTEPFACDCVAVRRVEGKLHVDFAWSMPAGMPERYSRRDVLTLDDGEWGRVRYNSRHSPYHTVNGDELSEWWYEKWVFNISVAPALEPRVFLDTPPAKVYSAMDRLW
jgi:hypothetical protein